MKTTSVIENFINGNLQDAKKGAKRFSFHKLHTAFMDDFHYSHEEAYNATAFLKGEISFQECCDKNQRV